MRGVPGGLGPLDAREGVLDRMRIEGQLFGEVTQVLRVRFADVDPDQAAILVEVVRDPLEREVLGHESAVSPQPAADRPA